jgi:hypothetical protein
MHERMVVSRQVYANDIIELNAHLKSLLESLATSGETTHDLLANLFKGYKAASDRTFVEYIKKKEDEYDEGDNISPDLLMVRTANKYKTMVEQGTWNATTAEEEKNMARVSSSVVGKYAVVGVVMPNLDAMRPCVAFKSFLSFQGFLGRC